MESGCREVRAFLGVDAFGRDLDGQLVQDEQGYLAALQQLRSAEACISPLGYEHITAMGLLLLPTQELALENIYGS